MSSFYDKDAINTNARLFANRRASTSLIPTNTDSTNHAKPVLSPSRRSIQSLSSVSCNNFNDNSSYATKATFVTIPNRGHIRTSSLNEDYKAGILRPPNVHVIKNIIKQTF